MTEMYSVLFAHPLVEAITTWDFNDGCWLKAPSGFVREDNSEKPAYEALKKLILGAWETHDTLTADKEGYITLKGFRGEYTIACGSGKADFSLKNEEDPASCGSTKCIRLMPEER